MIQLYKNYNTNYENDGDMNLKPIECKLTMELNGIWSIELSHNYDNKGRWKSINIDDVISIPMPNGTKGLFRIFDVDKDNIDAIYVSARHIFYDLVDFYLKDENGNYDVRPTNKSAQEALNIILRGSKFTGTSNISTRNTAYYIRKNGIEALNSSDDSSFLKRWGGEIYLNNFNIVINDRVGGDYGVVVEYGNNSTNIKEQKNSDDIVTRAIVVMSEGLMLPERYIDSNYINKYANIKESIITFDDIKVKSSPESEGFNTKEEAFVEARKRIKRLYEEEHIDLPKVIYTADIVQKQNIFKSFKKDLLQVNLGDTVLVKDKLLNINIETRCNKVVWDCIYKKYDDVTFGNVEFNYFDKQTDITNKIDNILNGNGTVKAGELEGFINATKASIKAQKDIAQLLDVRAIECEDLDPTSPNFGSWIGGTKGVMVSETRTPDNREWEYTSALTARGLVANMLYGKVLAGGGVYFDLENGEVYFNKGKIKGSNSSWDLDSGIINFTKGLIRGGGSSWDLDSGVINFDKGKISGAESSWDLGSGVIKFTKGLIEGGSSSWDLGTGEIKFDKGKITGAGCSWDLATGEIISNQPDESKIVISPTNGFYRLVGSTKNEYHSMSKVLEYELTTSGIQQTFEQNYTVPNEFKGKKFSLIAQITDAVSTDKTLTIAARQGVNIKNININDGTFTLWGQCLAMKPDALYGPAVPMKVYVSILVIA